MAVKYHFLKVCSSIRFPTNGKVFFCDCVKLGDYFDFFHVQRSPKRKTHKNVASHRRRYLVRSLLLSYVHGR